MRRIVHQSHYLWRVPSMTSQRSSVRYRCEQMTQSDKLMSKTNRSRNPRSAVLSIMLTSYADVIYNALNHDEPRMSLDANEHEENLLTAAERKRDGEAGGSKFKASTLTISHLECTRQSSDWECWCHWVLWLFISWHHAGEYLMEINWSVK